MSIELQTGTEVLVSDSSDAELYAAMWGDENYILKKPLELSMADPNTLVIGEGTGLQNGRHIRFKGSTELTIPSGIQAQKRSNVAVVRTTVTRDENTMETITHSEGLVLTGEPTLDGEPTDPEWIKGNLLAGDTIADMPIARVVTDGINVRDPEPMFETLVSEKEFRESQSHIEIHKSSNDHCTLVINKATRIAIATLSDYLSTTSGYNDFPFDVNIADCFPIQGTELFNSWSDWDSNAKQVITGWIGVRRQKDNPEKLLIQTYVSCTRYSISTQIAWMF